MSMNKQNETTPPAGNDNENGTNNQPNGSSRGGRRNNHIQGNITSVSFNFKGGKPEIGVVLGLKHEKIKMKGTYDDFIEKFLVYLTSNMTGLKDIVKTIEDKDDMIKRIN